MNATTAQREILQVSDLQVCYTGAGGTRFAALDGIDLSIAEGEIMGLVGESGCGKSTLGRTILGLEKPDRGSVSYHGLPLGGTRGPVGKSVRAEIQMIFQDPFGSLNPRRSVGQIVAEPLRNLRSMDRREIADRVLEILGLVGLGSEALTRRPHEFSGGQRQRIGIARALASAPKFVVADEPVSALDVSIQAQVVNLLKDLVEEGGLTMLFITHDLGVVRYIADRIAVMYLGQVVEVATREQIFDDPGHPYTNALISAVPGAGDRERIVLEGELPNPADPPPGCRFSTRCPTAQERCRAEAPALRELPGGRTVRCHFPLHTLAGAAAGPRTAAAGI